MADKKPKIIFRRIRGRIVPIRVKSDVNMSPAVKSIGGGLSIAAGAAIAIKAGHKSSDLLVKSAQVMNRAKQFSSMVSKKGQLGLFSQVRHGAPDKLFNLAHKLHRARNFTLIAGGVAGGALIAYGAKKILDQNKELRDNEQIKKFSTLSGGFGIAATLANFAYRRKLHPLETLKAAVKYAQTRKTLQYVFKGI